MAGVKKRIQQMEQSCGSYIKLSDFERVQLEDANADIFPYDHVSIKPQSMGELVECLTRYMLSGKKEEAFIEQIAGAEYAGKIGHEYSLNIARQLLRNIRGLGQASIENAHALLSFKSYFFYPPLIAGVHVSAASTDKYILPDAAKNVRIFVNRSVEFFKKNGPVVKAPFVFAPGSSACGSGVDSGMIDFLTSDTIWDMKVHRGNLKSGSALQVLIYWIMGQHSGDEIFRNITKIGLYNPRLNVAYVLDTSKIPAKTIKAVENEVICY